jgi:hypothetical protein
MKVQFRLLCLLLFLICFATPPYLSRAMTSGSFVFHSAGCSSEIEGFKWLSYDVILRGPLDDDAAGNDVVRIFVYWDGMNAWQSDYRSTSSSPEPHIFSELEHLPIEVRQIDMLLVDIGATFSGPDDYATISGMDVLDSFSGTFPELCNASESDVVMPPDERINWQYGDGSVVLYHGVDDEGNPALNLYCYDGENSWLGFSITGANMNAAPIQADGCNATFYILENGQLQINIINPEGKLYEIICDDLACEAPVMRYFDPNE